MENSEINSQSNDSILINDEIREYLKETAKWANFLAILGFIGLGLMAIAIIAMLFLNGSRSNNYSNVGGSSFIAVFYILLAVLYYYPINYLYKFSVDITKGVNSNDQELFTSGFKNLKSLFKFQGILTIVVISIYIFIFLGIWLLTN
jgi:hypothetical protein